jgi:hypothetical protein
VTGGYGGERIKAGEVWDLGNMTSGRRCKTSTKLLEAGVEEDEWEGLRKAFIDEANNELFPDE